MRFLTPTVGLLLAGGLLLSNFSGCTTKRPAANPKSAAGKTPGKTAGGGPAWQARLGRIVLVNSKLEFVLIDTGTAPAPEPGTRLRAYAGQELSGELSVSIHQQRPFLIADIVSGSPRVSDMVVPVQYSSEEAPETAENRPPPRPQRDTEPLPARTSKSAAPTRKIELDFEGTDATELPQIERRPPPPAESLLSPKRMSPDPAEAIIPGLPVPGKNPPR
jgi:hypothetical protein